MSHLSTPVESALPLTAAVTGQAYEVVALTSAGTSYETANRLAELGFLPGERVAVLARGVPGGEPLAVRVGLSTFALRRVEAECVRVVALGEGGGH